MRSAWWRPWSGVVLLLALGCAPRPAHTKMTPPGTAGASAVPHALVVDFRDGTPAEEVAERARRWGLSLHLNSLEGARSGIAIADGVEDVDAALARIRGDADVEEAEPLVQVEALAFTPNDPEFPKQWNLRMIHMPEAWERSRGKGVVVAVIDTGIAYEDRDDYVQVPDLAGARFVPGYDFVHDSEHPNDDNGHGTHVAGTIAQRTNNGVGVAGVAFEARLMPLKVLDRSGIGNSADIADAIRWAVDHGAKVLNLSLGGPGYSAVMERAVAYARRKGAVVVCAAGNAGTGQVSYPAAYAGAVAVGAVGPDGQLAPYSSWGEALDLLAPAGTRSSGPGTASSRRPSTGPTSGSRCSRSTRGPPWPRPTSPALPPCSSPRAPGHRTRWRRPCSRAPGRRAPGHLARGTAGWTRSGALEALGTGGAPVDWAPLDVERGAPGALLLSLQTKTRPGFLNVLLNPATLLPLLISTVGLWFLKLLWQRFVGHPPAAAEVLSLPLPDWERILFGRGRLASPLMYSALVPGVAALLAMHWRTLRPVVAGLSLGFAGFLLYAAWAKAPGIAYLPFTFLARPWLVLNGALAALVCRAMLRREARR